MKQMTTYEQMKSSTRMKDKIVQIEVVRFDDCAFSTGELIIDELVI